MWLLSMTQFSCHVFFFFFLIILPHHSSAGSLWATCEREIRHGAEVLALLFHNIEAQWMDSVVDTEQKEERSLCQ